MRISTITLNPAFDMHCHIEKLRLHHENYVTDVVKHSGGKGINISRALNGFGIDSLAYCVVGTIGGDEFLHQLGQENLSVKPMMTEGRIRENMTLHSEGKETRISFEGFSINHGVLQKLCQMMKEEQEGGGLVTFTGRLPKGITNRDAIYFLLKLKELGMKLVVDCNSFSIEDLLEIKPYLIKPNRQELEQLLGHEIQNEQEVFKTAKQLHLGGIAHVIVSLGEEGCVYWGKTGGMRISVPQVTPISTIGAGDSLIAGFLAGMAMERDAKECLKLAAAFGTAACLTEGTTPPLRDNILCLEKDILIYDVVV